MQGPVPTGGIIQTRRHFVGFQYFFGNSYITGNIRKIINARKGNGSVCHLTGNQDIFKMAKIIPAFTVGFKMDLRHQTTFDYVEYVVCYPLMPEWGTKPANHYLPRRKTRLRIHEDELVRADNPLKKEGQLPAPPGDKPTLDDITSW